MPTPSYLQLQAPVQPDSFSDDLIRPGEVVNVVYPEDPLSIGKKLVEYEVQVQYLDRATGTGRARTYRATLSNHLCGSQERERFVLRHDAPDRTTGIGLGSKVVVACLNGEHNSAVIIGGLRDTAVDDDRGLRDSGTLYEQNINGVKLRVGLDGTLRWHRAGPTDKRGEATSKPERVGVLAMEEDGSTLIGLTEREGDAPSQYVRLDASDGKAKVVADEGLHVGEATEEFPMFTTYRRAEGSMNSTLQAQLQVAQGAAATASTAMAAAAVLILVPVVGPILASPAVGQLSVQLGVLAGALGAMSGALGQFEGGAESYKSTKNKND